MILTNIILMAFAIFATRPKMGGGRFSDTDVNSRTVRLMTFDDFYQMPERVYEKAVEKVMTDKDYLYATIKKDIYQLGVDLSQRYKNMRISYDAFLFGLIILVLMFGACHVFF